MTVSKTRVTCYIERRRNAVFTVFLQRLSNIDKDT